MLHTALILPTYLATTFCHRISCNQSASDLIWSLPRTNSEICWLLRCMFYCGINLYWPYYSNSPRICGQFFMLASIVLCEVPFCLMCEHLLIVLASLLPQSSMMITITTIRIMRKLEELVLRNWIGWKWRCCFWLTLRWVLIQLCSIHIEQSY